MIKDLAIAYGRRKYNIISVNLIKLLGTKPFIQFNGV